MAADFTVIQNVRQRFGDQLPYFEEVLAEQNAPFVGVSKDFAFACPNVAKGDVAILQFESLGVTAPRADQPSRPRNILQINGVEVAGGITPGAPHFWKAHSLLVPANVLKEDNNVLHVESVFVFQEHTWHRDDFIIDNVVVYFKVRTQGSVVGGGVVSPA
jgi:hypothetical protein